MLSLTVRHWTEPQVFKDSRHFNSQPKEGFGKQTCSMKSPSMKSAMMDKKKKQYGQGAEIENDRLALPSLGWSGVNAKRQ